MSADDTELSVLFADISESSALYEAIGDTAAHALVTGILATLGSVIDSHGGRTIKEIGDEIMATCDTAEAAASVACDMHDALAEHNERNADQAEVSVRIGLCHGPVIADGEDVYGETVNIAARMVAQAKAWQILLPRATANALPAEFRRCTRFVDYTTIKGKGEIELVELLWEHDDLTLAASTLNAGGVPPTGTGTLRLRSGGREVTLSGDGAALVLGRNRACHLCVNEPLASRQHVRIERRNGRYILIDQSTNGTYLRLSGPEEHFVRRAEYPLHGSGLISLGRRLDDSRGRAVEFSIDQETV